MTYLAAKRDFDKKTSNFYRDAKWSNWKFRIYCHRKSSEERFLQRVEEVYGKDCKSYYGDWLRWDQMKGCGFPSVHKFRSRAWNKTTCRTCTCDPMQELQVLEVLNSSTSTTSNLLGISFLAPTVSEGELQEVHGQRHAVNILLAGTRPLSLSRRKRRAEVNKTKLDQQRKLKLEQTTCRFRVIHSLTLSSEKYIIILLATTIVLTVYLSMPFNLSNFTNNFNFFI